uniref:Small ribosomal subunit protein uS9c n=1 Tax=Dictyopteris divaricata TaxID=156996 RepID=A0A2I4Q371_9PHAE|nr:30S ribosomal protein S9 [Dictyopteris divaricata]YP_010205354.1 30S ribosomal protein S9 [Grateloupia livida]AQZ25065.1 30S ribosomal protein S9 [Dictyopteris divaricata]UAV85923.1 30S ribosomal protein S9 [Grateloupia livida]
MTNSNITLLEDFSIYGIGKKKESTAVVYLIPLSSMTPNVKVEINGRLGEDYFQQNFTYLTTILAPFKAIKLKVKYNIIAKVKGGGLTGQAESIKLAIARALCKIDRHNFRPLLKVNGLLTRDARVKERRKYGLKKARKSSQYSKR